jgi:sulfite reductase (NADPH) flavoprotein alpha-component
LYCPLDKTAITVGRDAGNDLVVDATFPGWQTVSRRHATIECLDQCVIVSDQGSRNGTYVNNRRTGTNILRDGWLVRFGEVEFLFRSNQKGGVS